MANDESNTIKFFKNSKNKPELSSYNWIGLNESIINIVHKLVDGQICYFGKSMTQIAEIARGFLKDNVGRNDWRVFNPTKEK